MALTFGQASVAGTVPLFTVPPGAVSLSFYSAAATTLYVGTSKTVSAANGYAVTTYPTTIGAFPTSTGAIVYGLNTAATTLAVNYVISTST